MNQIQQLMELPPMHTNPMTHSQLVQGSVAHLVNDPEVFSLEQVVLEGGRQMSDSLQGGSSHLEAMDLNGAQLLGADLSDPLGKKKGKQKKRKRSSEKSGKEPQLNTCLALGCDRQIKQRRLCPMHQKQKERNNGKIELKESVKFAKGRTPTPFSKHANKYAKLKIFDKKIDEWAGGREEGSMMLESFMESSYYQNRFPKQDDYKIFEQIGKNIIEFMKQLPEKSPLRRPLIKAISENVPLARLREVLPVSKQTVINSKKLLDSDNLLLTIRYKPNVTRSRKRTGMEGVGLDSLESDLSQVDLGVPSLVGQSGPQLEPPHVDTSANDIIQTELHAHLPLQYHHMGGPLGTTINSLGQLQATLPQHYQPQLNQLPSLSMSMSRDNVM